MIFPAFPYDRSSVLNLKNPEYIKDLERFMLGALESDFGGSYVDGLGDVSMDAICARASDVDLKCQALLTAKSSGVFCGGMETKWFLENMARKMADCSPAVSVKFLVHDGDFFRAGTPLLHLFGDARKILAMERTLLNTLQRLSGIATLTDRFVKLARKSGQKNSKCRIAATRKTLYGLLDKRAVAVGGGLTHRLNLRDAPMFKSNHLKLMNFDFDRLIDEFAHLASGIPFVTVEVTDFDQARLILERIERIQNRKNWSKEKNFHLKIFLLFDNFPVNELKTGLPTLPKPKNVYFEASGGINIRNISSYAKTGVDVLSIGALTHSVKAADFSLKLLRCSQ